MDDVTSQKAQPQSSLMLGMDGGNAPLYHEPQPQAPSPLGLCSNVYNPGRVSPFGNYSIGDANVEEGNGPPPFITSEPEISGQNDLDLEILLRGNLLQQQQQRIAILETSLSSMCNEIQKYREQLQELENDKGSNQKPQPKVQSRYWTAEEHHQFLIGLEKYGPRDVKSIAALVGTRNATQVRTHAQKYFLRVARENGEGGEGGEENKMSSRKRVMSDTLAESTKQQQAAQAQQALEAAKKSPELQPQEPQQPHQHDVGFGSGFGASMGYELGTDFDTSLEMGPLGSGVGGDSPLRFDDDFKAPPLKRMKEPFERNSRSVSPTRLEAVGANDLEELCEGPSSVAVKQ